ncbi:GNAT family N-acetyltransferase [Pseudovibrio exalbescens]|uniref:N-acetyltransferase domain-containing protein n=1 Tax=Pseudovibrio exalbescens TaxID=197461 RepID=A0A1U7JEC6_9HYPH|nr:N-acetyltransferase [Pseudovibrio exalbescens]OKL43032.1 hypothetical protein A3843_14925 [Pseudovibrio exalbescens]
MSTVTLRKAEARDAERLHDALEQLSNDLGDDHRATAADLLRHGFGAYRAFFAVIAEKQETGETLGVAMASPVYSTVKGAAGLYISDLWVSENARGMGLGPRLLAAVVAEVPSEWNVGFVKLTVYEDNPRARQFYDRLGFWKDPRETDLILGGKEFKELMSANEGDSR